MKSRKSISKIVMVDPSTGKITHTRTEDTRRKIIKAVIKGDRLNDGAPPYPRFQTPMHQESFLDGVAELITKFMTERFTYKQLQNELRDEVLRTQEKKGGIGGIYEWVEKDILGFSLPEDLKKAQLEKEAECLSVPQERLPEPLRSHCNPRSRGWEEEEGTLIAKLLVIYSNFSPLKSNRRIYENMALIFIACGLRPDMNEKDAESLSEALRRRRIKPASSL